MTLKFTNDLNSGINLDLDNLRLPPNSAVFIKNITQNVNLNAGAPALTGNNARVLTPLEGNSGLSVSGMPSGTNYCIGFYSSEQTNEGYFCVFNSSGNHTIWVIDGDTGVVTLVHKNTLLPFILDPQYFFADGRITMELRAIIDPVTQIETNFKFLVLANNYKYQCVIDVSASIATDSYTTSYFSGSGIFYNPLELIILGVTLPLAPVLGTTTPLALNTPVAYIPQNDATIIDTMEIDAAGTLYTIGSVFTINGGTTLASGIVTGIGVGGTVTSYYLTIAGKGYSTGGPIATTTVSGGGSGLTFTILSLVIPDSSKQNLLLNAGWQFRVRTWDVWGRPSNWSIISNVYTSLIGGGCYATTNSLARCVDINFDSGNALVKFIDIAFRKGVGNDPTGETETGWYISETIRKYDDSTGVEWYNRPLNPTFFTANSGMIINDSTNAITYTFCADKNANPVDVTDAAYTEPGLPISSSSVFSVSKSLGLANNVYDFEVPNQNIIDSVQFSVTNLGSGAPCPPALLRTIILYAVIWQPAFGQRGHCRVSHTSFVWGAVDGDCAGVDIFSVDQVFGDQVNPGFIAYLAGTQFSSVGIQGSLNSAGAFTPYGTPNGFNFTSATTTTVIQFVFNDIPAGNYVARWGSHKVKANYGNLQQTSTYIGGICQISDLTGGTLNNYSLNPLKEILIDCTNNDVVLNSSSSPLAVILDMSGTIAMDGYLCEQNGNNVPVEMNAVYMYSSGTSECYGSFFTDHNGFYFAGGGGGIAVTFLGSFCDGSGVTSQNVWDSSNNEFLSGGATPAFSNDPVYGGGIGNGILHGSGLGASANSCNLVQGYWGNKMFLLPSNGLGVYVTFPTGARRTIIQNIYTCGSSVNGVPGVPVVWTNGPVGQTDNNGNVVLVSHNLYDYVAATAPYSGAPPWYPAGSPVPDYSSTPYSTEYLIVSQQGSGCQWNICGGGCSTGDIGTITIPYLACGASSSGCTTPVTERILCLSDLNVQPNGFGIKGIQSGGKYPVAFWLHDVIGRHTSPLIRQGDNGYVFVPNLNDYKTMSLRSLQVTIPSGLLVDPIFTRMTILVGPNALFDDYFEWAADWIQYVNNAGNPDNVTPTAIRIYFNSLNEYNKLYNFQTNVAWDFLTTSQVIGAPADVCQFIMNGDGSWLIPQKGAAVSYDQYGTFFTVPYSSDLANLQNGCLFKIVRPKQNTTNVNLPYYEQGMTLNISNGLLPAGTYTIPYQDSYLLARTIPVPLFQGSSNPVSPGGQPQGALQFTSTNQNTQIDTGGYSTNNINNSNNVIIVQPIDYPTSFPFFFEGPSPSDLWGSHLSSQGRVGIPNPYETQFRNGTEIALSNNISNIGYENGMSTFLDANKQSFARNTYGDITVVLVEQGVCMVICNNDFFVSRYNQTQLEVSDNGQIYGQNPNGGLFTQPQMKVGSSFGVIPQNINTIQHYNGMVVFLDNKGHLIFSNFSEAKPAEAEGYLGYLLNKIAAVNYDNNNSSLGIIYWSSGLDPKNMEYTLSTFYQPKIAHPFPGASYINTQSQPDLQVNETLIFDLATGMLKSFASFTPEYYGKLPGFFSQRQFLSFKNGVPYIHHNNALIATPPPYCSFYGIQCEVRITHVVNGADEKMLPNKVKRFLYNEVYCRQSIPGASGTMPSALFFADVINTEKGQTSRLLVARWDLRDGYQCSAFLCDINTPTDPNNEPATTTNAILDGNPLQGRWLQESLTNNSAWTGTYWEMSAVVSYFNLLEKSAD